MGFEDVYARGYHGIILLDSQHEESASERDDYYEETYATLNTQGKPVKVHVSIHCNVYRPRDISVAERETMSREEYDALLLTHKVLDSPAWQKAQVDERNHVAQQKALLQAVSPQCIACQCRLVLRQNSRDKTWFFGCARYPVCHYTVSITHGTLQRLEQAGLIY